MSSSTPHCPQNINTVNDQRPLIDKFDKRETGDCKGKKENERIEKKQDGFKITDSEKRSTTKSFLLILPPKKSRNLQNSFSTSSGISRNIHNVNKAVCKYCRKIHISECRFKSGA